MWTWSVELGAKGLDHGGLTVGGVVSMAVIIAELIAEIDAVWVEVHLKNSDVEKRLTIEGPRPGGWTVTLSYTVCDADAAPFKIDDQFDVLITVRQPE